MREARVAFQPASTAPAMGRRVLGALADTVHDEALDDAKLLLTELMTNAIRYAGVRGGELITVSVRVAGEELVVEVADPGKGFDADAGPGTAAGTGWGLFLLEQLAAGWGVEERKDGGSVVWFRLPLRSA